MKAQVTINGIVEIADIESIDHIDIPELAEENNSDGIVVFKNGTAGTISGYQIYYISQEKPHLINNVFNFELWLERMLQKKGSFTWECLIKQWKESE